MKAKRTGSRVNRKINESKWKPNRLRDNQESANTFTDGDALGTAVGTELGLAVGDAVGTVSIL